MRPPDCAHRRIEAPIVVIALALLLACGSPAATIVVDVGGGGDYVTIQAGLNAASEGDTVLVMPGTYTGSSNRDLTFAGKGVTLRAPGGPTQTLLDCQAGGRGFYFWGEGPASVVQGLAITNGLANSGGAVYCGNAAPTFADCWFFGSISGAAGGGGVYCTYSSPTLVGCRFMSNQTTGAGGGLYCSSNASPALIDCTFEQNTATRSGGAVYCDGSSPAFLNCSFGSNHGGNTGGALYLNTSSPTLTDCVIAGNSTDGYGGGGVFCKGTVSLPSVPVLTGCTISGNTASNGGGMYCDSMSCPMLSDCRISENSATDIGGGVYFVGDLEPSFADCGFEDNTATHAGALMLSGVSGFSADVARCTFSGNSATNSGGAVYCITVSPTFSECTFSGNSATNRGGSLYCWSSNLTLANCTVSASSAGSSGGSIYLQDPNTASLTNCVIAFGGNGEPIRCGSTTPSLACCDIYGNEDGDWVGGIAGQLGTNGNISSDPLFCVGEDYTLCADSPCLPGANSCGILLGAHDVGCPACGSPVAAVSWGAVKAMFR